MYIYFIHRSLRKDGSQNRSKWNLERFLVNHMRRSRSLRSCNDLNVLQIVFCFMNVRAKFIEITTLESRKSMTNDHMRLGVFRDNLGGLTKKRDNLGVTLLIKQKTQVQHCLKSCDLVFDISSSFDNLFQESNFTPFFFIFYNCTFLLVFIRVKLQHYPLIILFLATDNIVFTQLKTKRGV